MMFGGLTYTMQPGLIANEVGGLAAAEIQHWAA